MGGEAAGADVRSSCCASPAHESHEGRAAKVSLMPSGWHQVSADGWQRFVCQHPTTLVRLWPAASGERLSSYSKLWRRQRQSFSKPRVSLQASLATQRTVHPEAGSMCELAIALSHVVQHVLSSFLCPASISHLTPRVHKAAERTLCVFLEVILSRWNSRAAQSLISSIMIPQFCGQITPKSNPVASIVSSQIWFAPR